MAKRKSWDEKSKGMHKSRKIIIDTVFGREDNTQKVFGYEGEAKQKREVGERWTDADGKEWEQKEGYVAAVTQFDDVREYLKKLTTCSSPDCKTIEYTKADKKLCVKTGFCIDCLHEYESKLHADGTWPYYEDYKISKNKLANVRELKQKYEDAMGGLKNQIQMVNEDGTISTWMWDIDIEQVKRDLQKDIDGAQTAIELLLERIRLLEEKIIELNHSELIR
jgi:hypothetical protein